MIQLSIDGPNTNWKVFDSLQKYREELKYSSLLNLGSCGLHMVHEAFNIGAQESCWNIFVVGSLFMVEEYLNLLLLCC